MSRDSCQLCRGTRHCPRYHVMSQDIGIAADLLQVCGFFPFGAFGGAGGLVVPGGVEGEVSQGFAGGGVDDGDVMVLDEDQDAAACRWRLIEAGETRRWW